MLMNNNSKLFTKLTPLWVVIAAWCGLISAQTGAQSNESGSIKNAVMQAIDHNPDVRASYHAFRASEQDVSVARAGWLPSVDLAASTGKANRDYDGRASYDVSYGEISISQLLFNGFRTVGEVEHFSSARQVRYFELLDTVESTALHTLGAYEDVQRNRKLVALAKENYAKHREVLAQIEDRATSGVGRRVDLEQVSGRLALAESNLLTEASNLHDSMARYQRMTGILPPAELAETAFDNNSVIPADITQVLYLAYQGNPGFHAAIKNIAAAQATVTVERSAFLPKVELRARQGATRNNNGFDDRVDRSRYGDEGVVELSLSYNLYNGGANRAAVRRSLEEVNVAKDNRDQVCYDLRQTAQVAFNDTQRIAEQQHALQQHRLSSDKVRIAYSDQFNIGQRTLLDLLDAENEYFQAGRAAVNAASDLTIAKARTLATMGKLLPALAIVKDDLTLLNNVDVAQLNVDAATACATTAPEALRRGDLISTSVPISSDALFAVNSSDLMATAAEKLSSLLVEIKNTEKLHDVRIVGHTDSTGSEAINLPLSKARAARVKDFLILHGLDNVPVSVEGVGSSRPIADNTTEQGRSLNRRVEVIVNSQH